MSKRTYTAVPEKGQTYLSELTNCHIQETGSTLNLWNLDTSCILNKGVTGCGGTTLFLKDDFCTVIAMPTVNAVINKQDDTVLCLFGRIDKNTFRESVDTYLYQCEDQNLPPKIVCTYDKLGRFIREYPSFCKESRLVVDEYHNLQTSISYRTACESVLAHLHDFASFILMSATPIHVPNLENVPIINVKWQNTPLKTIHPIKSNNCTTAVAEFIKSHKDSNIHVFCNSVTMIGNIVNKLGYCTDNNTRCVVSSNAKDNAGKIAPLSVSDASSLVKKLNFYTMTAYESIDVKDPDGLTVIVTDGKVRTTLVDVEIFLKQILGRIRDTKRNDAWVIYSPQSYKPMQLTYDEVKFCKMDNLHNLLEKLLTFNTDEERKEWFDSCVNSKYATTVDMKIQDDLAQLRTSMEDYASMESLLQALSREGYATTSVEVQNFAKEPKTPKERWSFEGSCKEYYEITTKVQDGCSESYQERLEEILKHFPEIPELIDELGFEIMEKNEFKKRRLVLMAKAKQFATDTDKLQAVWEALGYHTGDKVTQKTARARLDEIEDTWQLERGTLKLSSYYNLKDTTSRVQGKIVKAYIVLSSRITREV